MDSFQNVPSSPLLTTSWTVNFQSSTPLCSWLSTSALKKRHPARVSSQIKKKYLCLACDSEKEKKKSTSCGFLLTLRREREGERRTERERRKTTLYNLQYEKELKDPVLWYLIPKHVLTEEFKVIHEKLRWDVWQPDHGGDWGLPAVSAAACCGDGWWYAEFLGW